MTNTNIMGMDYGDLEQRVVVLLPKGLPYVPGFTWRGYRADGMALNTPVAGFGRCTYNPIDPWTMRRRDKPFDVFVNGTACLSYATLDDALSHLRARGFNMPAEPLPLYPNDTEVSVTAL